MDRKDDFGKDKPSMGGSTGGSNKGQGQKWDNTNAGKGGNLGSGGQQSPRAGGQGGQGGQQNPRAGGTGGSNINKNKEDRK